MNPVVYIFLAMIGLKAFADSRRSIPFQNDSYPTFDNFFEGILRWKDLVSRWNSEYNSIFTDLEILAIIYVESAGDPDAIPPSGGAGEIGLMQVTPIAFQDLIDNKLVTSFHHEQLRKNPELQIRAGILFLNLQSRRLNNSKFDVIRSYNVGYGGAVSGRGYEYLAKWQEKLKKLEKYLANKGN